MKKLLAIFFLALVALCIASGPQQVLVMAVPASSSDSALITSNAAGSTRNNYDGYVGFGYTETSAKVVTKLGRWVVSGNSGSHTLELYDFTASSVAATASINTSGLSVGYNYVSVTPYTTIVGHVYNVVSLEVSGGDSWYDLGSTYTIGGGVTSYGSCVGDNGTYTNNKNNYVPTNFLWH